MSKGTTFMRNKQPLWGKKGK